MESRVTSLLENVVGRLTKIETQQETQLMRESQIDQVIERLDTIHNRQTQLEHKLSDFSTQLEEEKVFMRDQLKEAQDKILHRLSELQQQNVSTRSQAASVGEEMKQLQATAGPNPVKETAEFCSQADGDVMDARLAKISETLEQSVKAAIGAEAVWLGNQTDKRISELCDKVGELAKETLKIVESIKQENKDLATDFKLDVGEEIRAQSEPMVKEVQESLTEMAEKNRESISQHREDMKTFYTEIVTQVKKTSDELPGTLEEIKKVIKDHMETVKVEIITDTNTAVVKVKDEYIETQKEMLQAAQEQIETKVKESMEKVTDELTKVKEELLKNTNSACLTLKETVIKSQTETIQNTQGQIEIAVMESTTQVTKELGKVKEELLKTTNSTRQKLEDEVIKSHKETIQNAQEKIEIAVKESTTQVTDEIGKVKELCSVTNSECQKLKEAIKSQEETLQNTQRKVDLTMIEAMKTGRIPAQKEPYIFDFYIENFRKLVRSNEKVRSEGWLFKEPLFMVYGYVYFFTDDRMGVQLKFSEDAERVPGRAFTAKVTMTDTTCKLPDVLVGTKLYTSEGGGKSWDNCIGCIHCDKLLQQGYGKNEGYKSGAILLRFEIDLIE